jgi:hypothetical protein
MSFLKEKGALKHNPNYYTWTSSCTKQWNQWHYWILAAVFRCCSCAAWNRYGRNFSCFVTWWVLVTDKHFLCSKILLPVSVLSYSVLPCRDMHCWMLCEQQQTISMWSSVQEWTHVLLVNTPCSITWECTCFSFHFCTIVSDCCWVPFWMVHPVHFLYAIRTD